MRFHFEEKRAEDAKTFIRFLSHTKGRWAGVPFHILDWQEVLLREIFGWVDDQGYRQYRTAYVEVPKKNGKTELAAAIVLKLLVADDELGAEVYSGAADREQATLIFNAAEQMVIQNRVLKKRLKLKPSVKRIVDHKTGSFYQALSTEAYTKHGLNIHGVVIDELHAIKDREFVDVLTQGASDARTQPLKWIITTAGVAHKDSIGWEYHQYAEKVRDGIIEDERFLPLIFGADMNANWEDEEVWKIVNPSLGQIFDIEKMREAFREAKAKPPLENVFRRLRLNQWTSQISRWLQLHIWDACSAPVNLTKGRTCYAGLDLSSTIDITALGLIFAPEKAGDPFDIFAHLFMPKDNIEERVKKDRVPYDVWVREGLITATPGNVIDYDFIIQKVKDITTDYNLVEIAYDRWGASKVALDLQKEGMLVIPMGQGFASMSPPTKELLNQLMQKKIRHGGHPVLRWMASNMVVREDPAGNIKPDKARSSEKIDGIVALIMALDRAIRHGETKESVYEKSGLLVLSGEN